MSGDPIYKKLKALSDSESICYNAGYVEHHLMSFDFEYLNYGKTKCKCINIMLN